MTVHGLDPERAKWSRSRDGPPTAQWMSARVPDATIVVSRDLADHYQSAYGRKTTYIPNGVGEPTRRPPSSDPDALRPQRGRYILFVGRLVPEKAPDLLLRAFCSIPGESRLVIAGGTSFTDTFVRDLRAEAATDPRVILPGYVYSDLLEELYTNAAVFVFRRSSRGFR